jgi:hypothetical protein
VIVPGAAELLAVISGMPCERCLATSGIPVFAVLNGVPSTSGQDEFTGWWDRGLPVDHRVTASLVMLFLLQDLARCVSVAEIAARLGVDARVVNLVVLLLETARWVVRIPDRTEHPLEEPRYRLANRGYAAVGQVLARELSPAVTRLATWLGLDATAVPYQSAQCIVDEIGGR